MVNKDVCGVRSPVRAGLSKQWESYVWVDATCSSVTLHVRSSAAPSTQMRPWTMVKFLDSRTNPSSHILAAI